MKIETALSREQVNSILDLVNERQDSLFDKLQTAVRNKASDARQQGIRDALKYWDAIDLEMKKVRDHISTTEAVEAAISG